MTFSCYFCNNNFAQKRNLHKHLSDNRCKSPLASNTINTHDIIQEQKSESENLKQQKSELEIEIGKLKQ